MYLRALPQVLRRMGSAGMKGGSRGNEGAMCRPSRFGALPGAPADPLVVGGDGAQGGWRNIPASFVVPPPPVSKANTSPETSFKAGAGSLAAGQNPGETQTRVPPVTWSPFNTAESYSFIADES